MTERTFALLMVLLLGAIAIAMLVLLSQCESGVCAKGGGVTQAALALATICKPEDETMKLKPKLVATQGTTVVWLVDEQEHTLFTISISATAPHVAFGNQLMAIAMALVEGLPDEGVEVPG